MAQGFKKSVVLLLLLPYYLLLERGPIRLGRVKKELSKIDQCQLDSSLHASDHLSSKEITLMTLVKLG